VARQVRQVDLAPTFLDWAGAGAEAAAGMDGQSLQPFLEGRDGPDRDAWSYVPTTGYGIALTRGDGRRFSARDLIWPGAEPYERLVDTVSDPGERVDLLHAEPAVASEMRDAVRRELARTRRGLLLEAATTGPAFELELEVAGAGVERLKSIAGPDASAKLLAPGRLGAQVSAAKPLRLLVEGGADESVELRIRPVVGPSSPEAKFRLEPADLGGGARTYARRGGVWSAGEPAGAEASIRIEARAGVRARAGEDEPATAVAEELRALGYLR
jgi:hypothetical protein